ncbi:MAG: hypothetical protein FWH55_13715 [Oscillospiraceae bacterium]|nr:hypothetical protein [Oscillospiraceae bacterium]
MPITQLSYARCGANGIGTGWQIVGKSLNLPSRVCTAFMQTQEIDLNAFLWQEDERERLSLLRLSGQVFFICSRHLGLGEDRRPNGISHAFILDELDALQILKCPEKLLQFNDFLHAIPEDTAFPYDYQWPECSQSMIIESTKITADLLRCVFTHLQSQRNESLCIIPPKAMRTSYDSAIIARSYMSAIMREIPFSLRQKLTFSSTYFHGQVPTVISFSQERQSCMYDCDTEAFFFPSGTGLVHNPLVDYCCDRIGDPTKIMRFQAMDDFVNDGGSLFFDQMELLLLAFFATADDAEIDSMTPQNILFVLANSVLGATQKPESDAILQLVARIIRICSSKGIVLPSRVAKEIDQIADKLHEDHSLRQTSAQYFARSIMHDNSSMFDLVLSYKTQKPLRYHAVIDEWERALQNGDNHLIQYFSYCIRTVSEDGILALIEEARRYNALADDAIDTAAQRFLRGLTSTIINFDGIAYLGRVLDEIALENAELRKRLEHFLDEAKLRYWERFEWSKFDLRKIDEYKQLLQETQLNCMIAQAIIFFCERMATEHCTNGAKIHIVLIEALIATEYIADANSRDSILAQLRDMAVKRSDMRQISFDSWLLLFYRNAKKQVDLSSMLDMFEKTRIIVYLFRDTDCSAIKSSVLLDKFELRDAFHDVVEQRSKRGEYRNYYQNLLRVADLFPKGIETASPPATRPWKKHD